MNHPLLSRQLTVLFLAAGISAAAQHGSEGHPALIQVQGLEPQVQAWQTNAAAPLGDWSGVSGMPELAPKPVLLAPTAFTPDGDGLNDKYFPFLAGTELRLSRFQVFDRWGRMLFTSNSKEGWDGTWGAGGAALPQGVYVWRLEAWPEGSEERMELAGSVTLIR